MKCQFEGCKNEALPERAGRGNVPTSDGSMVEIDFYLCEHHREQLLRGTAAHLSFSVKATPARPA